MIVFLTLGYQIKGNSVLGTLFHMKFVPSEYRLIYGSTIAFLWVLEHNCYSEIFVWCATGILSEIELWSISRVLFHSFGYLNSSNLLIGIELNMIAWNPCTLLFSFHSKSEYICERFVLCFVLSRKGTCTFCCSACASVICYLLLKLPSCTLVCGIVWTFARNGKGYVLRACDALPAPSDFT